MNPWLTSFTKCNLCPKFQRERRIILSLSFSYSQSWLTEQSSDLFEMKLKYYDPEKPGTVPSYTGNITEWEWKHKGDNADNTLNTYAFTYDKLSRLTDSRRFDDSGTSASIPVTMNQIPVGTNIRGWTFTIDKSVPFPESYIQAQCEQRIGAGKHGVRRRTHQQSKQRLAIK